MWMILYNQKGSRSPAASAWISRPFSDEEIYKALKSCNRDKAPGPDRFSAGFFMDKWNLLKSDVIKAIKNFFKHAKMLKSTSLTFASSLSK